jgi:hypothetical protein
MENTERIVPEINFKYWYDVNQEAGKTLIKKKGERRHLSMITVIENAYVRNKKKINEYLDLNPNYNELAFPLFLKNKEVADFLRKKTYNDFENLILSKIDLFDFKNSDNLSLLEIFDLIQIWGGKTGGQNPYTNGKVPSRINLEWIENYKKYAEQAFAGEIKVYHSIIKIPQLRYSFGSKHVFFWSRKNGNDNCLVVIDNKIAGTTGNRKPRKDIIEKIVNDIHCYAKENIHGLKPQQIEKALFSFHAHYFDNNNKTFTGIEKVDDIDYQVAVAVAKKLGIDGNSNNKKDSNNKPSGQNKSNEEFLKLPKSECLKIKTDIFISAVYVEKNKLEKYVDIGNKAKDKDTGKVYFKFKGESSGIKYL